MSPPRILFILAALALIAGVVPALAAQASAPTEAGAPTRPKPAPRSGEGETVVLQATQPEGMPLTEFIAWIGKHVALPVTYTPAARQLTATPDQRIKFDRPVKLPRSQVLRFGRQVLITRRIAIVEMGEGPTSHYLVESTDTPTVLQSMRRLVTEKELADLREDYVLVVCPVRLEHVQVQQVQTQIQRMTTQATVYGSSIIPMPSENAFLIIDFAPRAHSILTLIRSMDVKAAGPPPWVMINIRQASNEIAALKVRVGRLETAMKKRNAAEK